MKYKIFFSDIDDTLTRIAGMELTDYTISKLKEFKEKGLKFVPCTGRTLATIPTNLSTDLFDTAIFINGAVIYDTVNKTNIRELYIDLDEATKVAAFCKTIDVIVVFFMEGRQCADIANEKKLREDPIFKDYALNGFYNVDDLEVAIKRDNLHIGKILLYTRKKAEYTKLLSEKFPTLCFSSFNDLSVEITHKDAYKGNAISYVADMFGVSLDECIYAGDNDNDLSGLEIVGYPIAPANGSEKAKAIAKVVAEDCNHDGAIKEVDRLIKETI